MFAGAYVLKKSLTILLVIEFVLAIALGQTGFIHRSAYDRAFMEWYQHRTVETRKAFDQQKRITELERVEISPTGADIRLQLEDLASLMRDLNPSGTEHRRAA